MHIIHDFDHYQGVPLVAVQQASMATCSGRRLYEVWILPAEKQSLNHSFAERLLKHYQEIDVDRESLLEPVERCNRLASEFAVGLHPSEVRFYFKIHETKDGAIVSVVFGSKEEMRDFDAVASDEASD